MEIARFPAVSPLLGFFFFAKQDEFNWELLSSEGARLKLENCFDKSNVIIALTLPSSVLCHIFLQNSECPNVLMRAVFPRRTGPSPPGANIVPLKDPLCWPCPSRTQVQFHGEHQRMREKGKISSLILPPDVLSEKAGQALPVIICAANAAFTVVFFSCSKF